MKILGIIPARFASSRFPGKPLADIGGKSMIQRVYEQALKAKSLNKVVVATDDARILEHVISFGGEAYMTAQNHPSGTDRCFEALQKAGGGSKFDYIINIQGDEPYIDPETIDQMAKLLDFKTEIATAVKKITDYETLFDPNVVKAVLTMRKQCLYFSRQTVPYVRGFEPETWLDHADFYKHIGLYAYRNDVLEQISHLPPSPLENTEKLEQLRWLGYGYKIYATITNYESIGVDTPEDLEKLNKSLL
ncbi:3-deoxy-manno-octulosonate cytidylyltransferase [Emticicia aquatilis]|uniref:3-deoxy-manno-octulosonate cytidylyltransferase n=1 Tax=Emticicia aquatilis TaxID=1537369 RepID=A0A916YE85_9BACT|nr:3-deoxy-manno-octulosonate cytidylyltransferase [Emticicia aquatilis]GGD41341.1 3-deoxy-manno-octulosonate cytidylyltransferase [Emticicia aquatilis]